MAKKQKKKQTVSEALKQALEEAWAEGITSYRIGKNAGMHPGMIDRFYNGERSLRLEPSVDKLCEALGLELVKKR